MVPRTSAFAPPVRVLAGAAVAAAIELAATPAGAFVTNCHQGITTAALTEAAWPLGASPPPLAGDYALLPQELPVGLAPSAHNLWAMSALMGNFFVDYGSNDTTDIAAIADFAAQPDLQRTHCLRAPADDGAAGDAQAVASCRAYILEQIGLALGDGDVPDLEVTEPIRLRLVFRGAADVLFPSYAFHLGSATHALQDGFSHVFRSPDERMVKTVLNWVDWVAGNGYDEARDGFRHLYALDQCQPAPADGSGDYDRPGAAQEATTALLAALANDDGGRAGRLARASAVLDAWFGIQPDCTAANNWCDAPERLQTGGPFGCSVAARPDKPGRGVDLSLGALALALLAAVAGRRRRRSALAIVVLALALGGVARADNEARGEVKGSVVAKATPEEQRLLALRRFGVLVKGGIAIDNAGYDVGVGARYDLSKPFTVGVDGEYNPWFSIDTGRQVSGTTNIAAVGIYRFDVRDYLELRLTLYAGVSVLNFSTFAAKSGSVGPYFALSPLGIAIRMGGHLRFIVDPAEIAVPVPQTTGIPFIYRQHRFSVAMQANF